MSESAEPLPSQPLPRRIGSAVLRAGEAQVRRTLSWSWQADARKPGDHDLPPGYEGARVTILLSAYWPKRVANLWPITRQALKCSFVERVIITNNNPELHLTAPADLDSQRVVVLNQPERRGAGYRWQIARDDPGAYFIALDDDLLIRPPQLALLFQRLLDRPTVPHGLTGKLNRRYVVGKEASVDLLYAIYALSREHVTRYWQLIDELAAADIPPELIERWADDVVVSHSGAGLPLVHNSGYLLFCPTATSSGTSVFKEPRFRAIRQGVFDVLDKQPQAEVP